MRGVAVVTGEDFLSPSFPAVALTAGRTWHHVTRLATRIGHRCAIGCRGFAGPIPPPLWMSVMQLYLKRDKRISPARCWPGGLGWSLVALPCRPMKKRVLVASNRGPVSYEFGADGTLTGRRGGGGLVAGVAGGLAAVAPETEVAWI